MKKRKKEKIFSKKWEKKLRKQERSEWQKTTEREKRKNWKREKEKRKIPRRETSEKIDDVLKMLSIQIHKITIKLNNVQKHSSKLKMVLIDHFSTSKTQKTHINKKISPILNT